MQENLLLNAANYHCPRFEELPTIPLYLDQMLIVIREAIGPFFNEEEPVVTKMMINNYVKQKFISPPEKKKYGREQLAKVIIISVLKRCFSIGEIDALIEDIAASQGLPGAYNLFVQRLEKRLSDPFDPDIEVDQVKLRATNPNAVFDIAITALFCKLYVQFHLDHFPLAKEPST